MPNLREWMQLGVTGCPKTTMDPQIKLFGQTIGVMSSHTDAGADAGVLKPTSASPQWDTAPLSNLDGGDRVLLGAENEGVVEKLRSARSSSRDEFLQPPNPTELVGEYRSPNTGVPPGASDSEGANSDELKDQAEGEHSQSVGDNKSLQKPDKVVACPRCDSLDTKFCYYNNYNVNQPRHFCKNCQRYWTAGGTLRNVPVGAGRRKNKHGGLQRDCTEASVNCSIQSDSGDSASQLLSCTLGSPTSQKGSSLKNSQPKRMAGQSSPMRSPGGTMSFGPDSGIPISPSYSLHQNGRLPFQSFQHSQGFITTGAEVSAAGSSDSASTLGQRLVRFPSGNGFDKDCSRSSLSGQMQDAPNLQPIQTAFNPSMLQLESSGIYRSVLPSGTSGWAGNGAPVGFHNGEWPHGYHLDLDGKQPVPSSQGASYSTSGIRNFNVGPTQPSTSSWSPASPWSATSWGANHVSVPQRTTSVWAGGQPMVPTVSSVGQSPVAVQTTLGKRGLPDGGRSDACMWSSKASRTDDSKSLSAWSMLGKNQSEVNTASTTLKLFQPKLELAVACEKDSFMNRHFTVPVARPVPFQVTI